MLINLNIIIIHMMNDLLLSIIIIKYRYCSCLSSDAQTCCGHPVLPLHFLNSTDSFVIKPCNNLFI